MRKAIVLGLLITSIAFPAVAQDQRPAPAVKPLNKAECANISKKPDGSFYIKGETTIGRATYSNSEITRNGVSLNGVDTYDVIQRSCFSDKPLRE